MATLLRVVRPLRNELKKILKEAPTGTVQFDTPDARKVYIRQVEIYIATLKATRKAVKELYDQLVKMEITNADERKVIDEVLESDSMILLEAARSIEICLSHIQSIEKEGQQPQANQGSATVGTGRTQPTETNPTPSVKLPTLELRKFAGDATQWREFWDTYQAMVHTNAAITPVAKFAYLKNALTGEALNAISGLSLTTENYDQAIDILKKRYGSQQLVINMHYTALSNLNQATEATASIRQVVDTMEKHLRSLEAMGEDVKHNHFISMILAKLPKYFTTRLEESKGQDEWTVETLRSKIQQLVKARESAEQHQKSATTSTKWDHQKKPAGYPPTASSLMVGTEMNKYRQEKCIFCERKHWSDECRSYPTIEARKKQIPGRCFVCMKKGHSHKDCTSEKPCVYCNQVRNHHRSLCRKKFPQGGEKEGSQKKKNWTPANKQPKGENAGTVGESSPEELKSENTNVENSFINTDDRGILQTASAWVSPANANEHSGTTARMVLDCGSQRTYVTHELAMKLNAKPHAKETLLVFLFGAINPKRIETDVIKFEMKLMDRSKFKFTAHAVQKIGEVHHPPIEVGRYGPLFKTLPLADHNQKGKEEPRPIDILIGNNYYWDLVTSEKISLAEGLYLVGTKLGWTVSGRSKEPTNWKSKPSAVMMTQVTSVPVSDDCHIEADPPLMKNENFNDWWSLENLGIHDSPYNGADEAALAKFNETIQHENQRYFVTWPWKTNVDSLPTNFALSVGRMNSQNRRFKADPSLLEKYDSIIRTQEELGIIEKIPTNENGTTRKHYLPHHPVITPDRSTTKVRIVYDGSAKVNKDSPSINECMYRGPVILDDVCALLIRFRLHPIALISDIEKAFLQVGLQSGDRDVTRFIWMKEPKKVTLENNMQIYRFARVPFGIIASPFLLGATILHHLSQYGSPKAQKIRRGIYVDNVIAGADSIEDAIQFYNEAKAIFQSTSMNLREWLSSDPVVMESIPEHDQIKKTRSKLLGLMWNTQQDTLSLTNGIAVPQSNVVITKRQVLKSIAQIFDPLGIWSPTVVIAKLFLQSLWVENKDWDAPIGEEKQNEWKEIMNNLVPITSISVPRYIGTRTEGEDATYELHCFTDASKKAYGACVYLRITNKAQVSVKLLFAKAKVTPLREITIPRLELLATNIGGRLMVFIEKAIDTKITKRILWTDSQCVLHWIQSMKPLSVFVTNRVKEIRSLPNTQFRYVSTDQNPADLVSRGITGEELRNQQLWWSGPNWLSKEESNWPAVLDRIVIDTDTIDKITSEEKKSVIFEVSMLGSTKDNKMNKNEVETPFGIDHMRYSSLTKLIRITAWCKRFCDKLRSKCQNTKPNLDAEEMKTAKEMWVKYIQKKNFEEVFDGLNHKKRVPLQEQLGLWIDEKGILHCQGRLMNANLDPNATFPVLLPKKDWLTSLVIQNYHEHLFHSGVAHTLSQIRHEFWIPSGRSEVFHLVKSCRKCKRFSGGPYQPPAMPALPKVRITETPPFTNTGLDYLGPLYVKEDGDGKDKEKKKMKKIWICLFTCMVTRAVHLELVEDLTADQFLLALRWFIARWGKPNFILSDNAKQFKLAKSAIDHLWKKVIQNENVTSYVSQQLIQWKFIPERAPWMGGFYEHLVQSIKCALRRSIQNLCLTSIQLTTIVMEIESILNTRPMTYVGSDFRDGWSLTPAHFLTLNPKVGTPSMDMDDPLDPQYTERLSSKEALLRSWTKGERHLQMFWTVWKNEYLLNLRERHQNQLKRPKSALTTVPKIGDVVHVRNESTRGSWPLARIVELTQSADGNIRSAKVRLPTGTILTRAIVHLYPMELEDEVDTQKQESIPDKDPQKDENENTDPNPQKKRPERMAAKLAKQKLKEDESDSESSEESENASIAQDGPSTTANNRKSIGPVKLSGKKAILAMMCILITLIQPGLSLQPLLCEKGNAKFTLNLTDSTSCQLSNRSEDGGKVYMAKVAIYKRNIARYTSQAFKCSKVKTISEAYTNFAKAGWEERQREETVPISVSDCWSMIQNRRCREGPLLGSETSSYTENKVTPPYTTGNAWDCCRWYSKEVTNCFMIKGKVYQSYKSQMESNLANVANCQYENENCVLHDRSILVWKKNDTANCEYVFWRTAKGKVWNNQFLSDDFELAFTWNSQSEKVELCDRSHTTMTDQGVPMTIIPLEPPKSEAKTRTKREKEDSDILAIRLQALEARLESFFQENLSQAFYTACRTIQEIQQINLLLAHAEPTLIARKILKDQNVMGRLHGTVMEIWPCNPVDNYMFLSMDKKCTEWIPVNYTAQGHTTIGYMDPKTKIIYANAPPTECDLMQETYLLDEEGKIQLYSAHSREIQPFHGHLTEHTFHTTSMAMYHDFKPVIHKSIQMHTQDELRGQRSLNDIFASVENHAAILNELSQIVEWPSSAQANAILETASRYTPLGLLNQLVSKVHWLWIQICCIYVTTQILWKVIIQNFLTKAIKRIQARRETRGEATEHYIISPPAAALQQQKLDSSAKSPILAVFEEMKKEQQ